MCKLLVLGLVTPELTVIEPAPKRHVLGVVSSLVESMVERMIRSCGRVGSIAAGISRTQEPSSSTLNPGALHS